MKGAFEITPNSVVVKLNKNFYPREVLIQASYVKLEEFYIYLDEEGEYFLVELRFKDSQHKSKTDFENAANSFLDELVEAHSYINQMKKSSDLRQIILERALLSQEDINNQNGK